MTSEHCWGEESVKHRLGIRVKAWLHLLEKGMFSSF